MDERKLVDPDMRDIAKAWEEVTGYPLESTMMTKVHATAWAWVKGMVETSPGRDGSTVRIQWTWSNGTMTMTVGKITP